MSDTIRTETDLLEIFKDAQPAGSITAQDTRDLIVSSGYLHSIGWQFYLDSRLGYGSPSVYTLAGGVRHQITIDGATETLGHPSGAPAFWNVSTNKIVPSGLNNFGLVRLALTMASVGAGSNYFDVELDVSGLPNGTGSPHANGDIIFEQTEELIKGAGNDQHFNFTIPLFSGPNFQANGGVLYLEPLNDVTIWLKGITAIQIYAASPAVA